MIVNTYIPSQEEIVHEITVNMTRPDVSQPIRLVQGDMSLPLVRVIVMNDHSYINLNNNYDSIDLLIQNGEDYYTLNTIGLYADARLGTTRQGCYFRIPQHVTRNVGTFEAVLRLTKSDGVIFSVTPVKVYITAIASNEIPIPPYYIKPEDGIPETDLSEEVRNTLHTHSNKAVLDEIEGAEEADAVEVDTAVTSESDHLITSGAVAEAISNISTDDIPANVKYESDALISKSNSHGTLGRTIRFIAFSDAHHTNFARSTTSNYQKINLGNKHCGQAIKYISDKIGLDFIAFMGDGTEAGESEASYMLQTIIDDITELNSYISNGSRGFKNIRLVGNHDEMKASDGRLQNDKAYSLYGRYNDGVTDGLRGCGYYDFVGQKVRVIYLNTSDTTNTATAGTLIAVSSAQVQWLTNVLAELNAKTDAEQWHVIFMSHVALDYGAASSLSAPIISFIGENKAKVIGNFHGHFHCYNTGYVADAFNRICIPNSCFFYNNHYSSRSEMSAWTDATTYNKTAYDGVVDHGCKDTSFSLVTIDIDNKKCYIDNFGAGIDREISFTPPIDNLITSIGTIANSRCNSSGTITTDSRGNGYYVLANPTTQHGVQIEAGDVIRIKGLTNESASESYKCMATNEGFTTFGVKQAGLFGNTLYDSVQYDATNHILTMTFSSSCFLRFSFKPVGGIADCIITKNQTIE